MRLGLPSYWMRLYTHPENVTGLCAGLSTGQTAGVTFTLWMLCPRSGPCVRTVGTAYVASTWRERRLQLLWSRVCVTQQWYPDGGLQQPWHTHCVYVLTQCLHIVLPSRCRERCSVRLAVSDSCDPVTVACRAPLSLGCFRHEYYGGCHFLLEGIFLTQGPNPHLLCLLHRSWILYLLSQWGSHV